jgi:uncharacterized protein (TIGR02996 family)
MSFQVPDWITFRGEHRQLVSYPLEAYLRELPAQPDFRLRGTGQSRGYVASWEIRGNNTFWLTGLQTRPDGDGPDPGIALLFSTASPVAATWVNQCLWMQDVRQRRFSLFGNGITYTRETYLSVWHGRMVIVEEVDGKTGRRIGGDLTSQLEDVFGPEESSFLRAAFADPDDAAPRLVYADWLDDRNDPRAGVVRIAERLRRLDPAAASQERSAHVEVLRRGLDNWLWTRVMDYHVLRTQLTPIIT